MAAIRTQAPSNRPPHRPPANDPLRIRIQGPLESIQKLFPEVSWREIAPFPQPVGLQLARITHDALYGRMEAGPAIAIRDEYLAWVKDGGKWTDYIDYYGITFDHLVAQHAENPEVLVINTIEVDESGGPYADGGQYARDVLVFLVDPKDFTGKRVLAVPRCCQRKKGKQNRKLINMMVAERDEQNSRISHN